MILPIGKQVWQRCEPIKNGLAISWAGKALQQFLQYKSRGQDVVAGFDGTDKRAHWWRAGWRIAPERQ